MRFRLTATVVLKHEASGRILISYALANPAPTTAQPSFVNDVVLGKRHAWFTDSRRPELYRVDRYGSSTAVTTPAARAGTRQVRTRTTR